MKKFSFFQLVAVILAVGVVLVVSTLSIVSDKTENNKVSNVVETTVSTTTPTATITVTSTPWPSPEVDIRNSYGDYYDCEPDPVNPGQCIYTTYHYEITMSRQNCEYYLCPTKINFTSGYGDGSMWIDYYDSQTSIKIYDGVVMDLPRLGANSWNIGPRAFFELSLTPSD